MTLRKKARSVPPLPGKHLSSLVSLSQKVLAERQLPDMLSTIASEGARLLDAESTSILLYDRERCELISYVTLDGIPIRFDARLGIAGTALMEGQPIHVSNAQEDSRFFAGIDKLTKKRTRNLLAIPLKNISGDCLGVFEILNKKKGRGFTPSDIALANSLVTHLTPAIETAQIVQLLSQQGDQLRQENSQLWKEMEGRILTQNLMGTSPRMQNIIRLIDQIQDSSVDVLIIGENGTGKELIAKAIHYSSLRARRPFVAVNCAALPETLVESELFGIEKGVATGVESHVGKFEQAGGGTLFLDEIGDMGKGAQAKILRVLQERVFDRVGGRMPVPVDVRVIAATNKNLEQCVADGTFREDLYYRLKIIHIPTPALREIPGDIPMFANFFLNKYCQNFGKDVKTLSPAAMSRLVSYVWPGNVRQLENEIKRLVVTVRRATIKLDDLDESVRAGKVSGYHVKLPYGQNLHKAVEDLEKRMIEDGLVTCHYNQVKTAELLGLSRQGLIKKMKRYGINGR